MTVLPEAVNVMMLVIDVFERLQIPYFIGGSMASALHGVARSTFDADIVAEIHLEQAGALVKALGAGFYADEEMIRGAIHQHSSFNLIHLATMFKVDVFIRKERPFDRIQFQRRVEQLFATNPEQKAFMTTAEDIGHAQRSCAEHHPRAGQAAQVVSEENHPFREGCGRNT